MSEYGPRSILPGWKRTLWREISQAAQAKNAFHQDDYVENGDLNIRLDKFEELSAWLVRISTTPVTIEYLSGHRLLRAHEGW
jgi:hypothetical protein